MTTHTFPATRPTTTTAITTDAPTSATSTIPTITSAATSSCPDMGSRQGMGEVCPLWHRRPAEHVPCFCSGSPQQQSPSSKRSSQTKRMAHCLRRVGDELYLRRLPLPSLVTMLLCQWLPGGWGKRTVWRWLLPKVDTKKASIIHSSEVTSASSSLQCCSSHTTTDCL